MVFIRLMARNDRSKQNTQVIKIHNRGNISMTTFYHIMNKYTIRQEAPKKLESFFFSNISFQNSSMNRKSQSFSTLHRKSKSIYMMEHFPIEGFTNHAVLQNFIDINKSQLYTVNFSVFSCIKTTISKTSKKCWQDDHALGISLCYRIS